MLDTVAKPTEDISVREVFGIDTDMKVKGFAERADRVPMHRSRLDNFACCTTGLYRRLRFAAKCTRS